MENRKISHNQLKDRLIAAMAHRGVNQKEVSEAVGVGPASVNDWIAGRTQDLRGSSLLLVARFLKVRPWWLAFGEGDMADTGGHWAPPAPEFVTAGGLAVSLVLAMRSMSTTARRVVAQEVARRIELGSIDAESLAVIEQLTPQTGAPIVGKILGMDWRKGAALLAERLDQERADRPISYTNFVIMVDAITHSSTGIDDAVTAVTASWCAQEKKIVNPY